MANNSKKSNVISTTPATTVAMTSSRGSSSLGSRCRNKNNGSTPIKVGLYDIGAVIGEGNFATVRFARHRHTKSDVSSYCLFYFYTYTSSSGTHDIPFP